jgi:hypothetical protein
MKSVRISQREKRVSRDGVSPNRIFLKSRTLKSQSSKKSPREKVSEESVELESARNRFFLKSRTLKSQPRKSLPKQSEIAGNVCVCAVVGL